MCVCACTCTRTLTHVRAGVNACELVEGIRPTEVGVRGSCGCQEPPSGPLREQCPRSHLPSSVPYSYSLIAWSSCPQLRGLQIQCVAVGAETLASQIKVSLCWEHLSVPCFHKCHTYYRFNRGSTWVSGFPPFIYSFELIVQAGLNSQGWFCLFPPSAAIVCLTLPSPSFCIPFSL